MVDKWVDPNSVTEELSKEDKDIWGLEKPSEEDEAGAEGEKKEEESGDEKKEEEGEKVEEKKEDDKEEESEESLSDQVHRLERESKGLYEDLKDERHKRQEAEDKAKEAPQGPQGPQIAPFGYIDIKDEDGVPTGQNRPMTEQEYLDSPAKTGAVLQAMRLRETAHKEDIDNLNKSHSREISDLKLSIHERDHVKEHPEYLLFKKQMEKETEEDADLKIYLDYLREKNPSKYITAIERMGKSGASESAIEAAKREGATEKEKELAIRIKGGAGKPRTGAGAGGAAEESDGTPEYYMKNIDAFRQLSPAERQKILSQVG